METRGGDPRPRPVGRWELRVTGRVQGVGYRDRVRRAAEGLRLAGAVWNAADGSVRVEVQGSEEFLSRFEQEILGPRGASDAQEVRRVRALPIVADPGPFEVRR